MVQFRVKNNKDGDDGDDDDFHTSNLLTLHSFTSVIFLLFNYSFYA